MQQQGIHLLIKSAKKAFRIPENLDYYSQEDFRKAERKFLQLCVIKGQCPMVINLIRKDDAV